MFVSRSTYHAIVYVMLTSAAMIHSAKNARLCADGSVASSDLYVLAKTENVTTKKLQAYLHPHAVDRPSQHAWGNFHHVCIGSLFLVYVM